MLRKPLNKHNVCHKLENILPLVKKNIPELSGLSLSSLVVATAFSPSRTLAPVFHTPGCPFYSRQLPLTDFIGKTPLQDKVCISCLKKVVHFLSSEAFCDDMEMRCVGESFEIGQVPQQLLSKLVADYGSLSSFIDDLLFFSCSQASPGRTWVVFDGEKISIMNLPSNIVPLVYGLWPLALVNMSERHLCAEILALSVQEESTIHTASQSIQKPFWCRAARNPFSMTHTSRHYSLPLSALSIEGADERLEKIRKQVAKRSVNSMQWSFVNNQLIEAINYFSSPGRCSLHTEFRAKKEREASQLALRKYKERSDDTQDLPDAVDSTHVVSVGTMKHSDSNHDISRCSESFDTNSFAAKGGSSQNFDSSETKRKDTKESLALSEIKEETPYQERTAFFASSESADANTTTQSVSLDPKVMQHADGSWEYQYQNGNRTFVYTDGTKVFRTESVTTTVRTDGSTLFEYANGSSILDRSDGIRITTYPGGASKEEVIHR